MPSPGSLRMKSVPRGKREKAPEPHLDMKKETLGLPVPRPGMGSEFSILLLLRCLEGPAPFATSLSRPRHSYLQEWDCPHAAQRTPLEAREIWRHTQRDCHVKLKTETEVMFLQAKVCERWPTFHQKLGKRPETDSPFQPPERTNPADTFSWTSSPLNCQIVHFCCLSHPVCGT